MCSPPLAALSLRASSLPKVSANSSLPASPSAKCSHAPKAKNARQFEELLNAEFESKWEVLRKTNRPTQPTLLGGTPPNELNLGT